MGTKSLYRSVDLINSISKTTIRNQLIKKTDRILLAISGGQDSICLLVLFNQLYAQMQLHLGLFWCHHLWQIDSFSLMRQTSKISFLFQFNSCFAIPSKFVPSELLARNWRHNSSYRICLFYNYSTISLAHSANDKAETILLNLMRGTGISGLSPLHWTTKISQESVQNQGHMSQHPTSLISLFSWSPSDSVWFDGNSNKQNHQNRTSRINKLVDGVAKPTRIYANQKCSDNDIEHVWRTFSTPQIKKSIPSSARKNKNIWKKDKQRKNQPCWNESFEFENLLRAFPLRACLAVTWSLSLKTKTNYEQSQMASCNYEGKTSLKGKETSYSIDFTNNSIVLFVPSGLYLVNRLAIFKKNPRVLHLNSFKIDNSVGSIEHLHYLFTLFPLLFSKNPVTWMLERVFFQKPRKRMKLKPKNRNIGKNKTETKGKTWFYFVSYTFFKNCSTSLEQIH